MAKKRGGGLRELAREDRLLLLRFVCSFAWADLSVAPEERRVIGDLMDRLDLDEGERAQVARWLEEPPDPESVDPQLVPKEHRSAFVKAVETVITADGQVVPSEREQLLLLAQMLR